MDLTIEQKTILKNIDNEINKPLYDDLSDYLRGIRDILNIVYDREYIDMFESEQYILDEIEKVEIR